MSGQAWFMLCLFLAVLFALAYPLANYMARISDAQAGGYAPIRGWIGKFERGRLRALADLKKRLEGETDG